MVARQVLLEFEAANAPTDLSAVSRDGQFLWLAGDELPRLERLTIDLHGGYHDHRVFPISDLVALPEGPDKEVDVEGIDRLGEHLWVVGSHSLSRKKVEAGDDDQKVVSDLAKVRAHANRHVLLRVPVTDDGELLPAASLNGLSAALADDEHLAPFLPIPSKDNGLDIEGVVAVDGAVLVGLRGPVLRGWAVVLELVPAADPAGTGALVLTGDPPYRKLFLDLDGLGVRDLCRDGEDLLVLAGPTMDLDGPVRLYRWHGAARARPHDVVRGNQITRELPLEFGDGDDHAEGVTLLPAAEGGHAVLVVYDSPAPGRVRGDAILADVVPLPH